MAVKANQIWTLQNKWQSRRIWFVLTAICFVESSCLIRLDSHLFCREFMFDVKRNQTWTLYKTNGSQEESNMNSLHNKWLSRRFKHERFVLTAICFVESSCLNRLDSHLLCREFMFDSSAVKRNQTWTLYKTNGSQDESNMNSLQKKWLSRRIKHELSTKQMAVKRNHVWFLLTAICFVESSCLIRLDCHLFCREFMFD
jgi:hypothetical protein